jgi:hypothetical protein
VTIVCWYNYCFWTLSVVLFLFKTHNVSETAFCLRLQVEPTHFGPIDRVTLRVPALKSKSKLCYDRRSFGQSVLVSSTHLGLQIFSCVTFASLLMWVCLLQCTIFYILHARITWMYIDTRPLSVQAQYSRSCPLFSSWPSPAQSFSRPSPARIISLFYCLRF